MEEEQLSPGCVDPDDPHDKCNPEWLYNLSAHCVDGSDPLFDDCNCYPLEDAISLVAGVWCVINAVAGTSGNLLTLLAIPAAKRNNRSVGSLSPNHQRWHAKMEAQLEYRYAYYIQYTFLHVWMPSR